MSNCFSPITHGPNTSFEGQRPETPTPDSPPNTKRARLASAHPEAAPSTCATCNRPVAPAGRTAGEEPHSEDFCTGPHPSQQVGPEDPHPYCPHSGCHVNSHYRGETAPAPESWWCCHPKEQWALCDGCAGKNISHCSPPADTYPPYHRPAPRRKPDGARLPDVALCR